MLIFVIINGMFYVPIELFKLLILTITQLPLCLIFRGRFRQFVKNQYITIDQNVNVLCGGATDETISSRVHKSQSYDKVAKLLVKFLDLFEKNHAEKSAEYNITDDSIF